MTLRTGKRPAQPARPHLKLAPFLQKASLDAPPASVDYTAGTYPMYANDNLGDCVEAGIGHQVGEMTRKSTSTEALFQDSTIIGFYSEVTGYNPNDPSTDQGTYTQDALAAWRKSGLGGHVIAAYAALDLANTTELKQAIQIFGGIGIGFNFPASAMDQFNAGKPWTVVKGSPIEGGHYVVAVGYDATYLYVLTWGAVQKMAWSFLAKYADEGWGVISTEQAMASGADAFLPTVVDLYGLGQAFNALTGEANPFPQQPTPVTPPPGVTAAQVAAAARSGLDAALKNLGV